MKNHSSQFFIAHLLMSCGSTEHIPLGEGPDPSLFVCSLERRDGTITPMFEHQVAGDGCNECRCSSASASETPYTTQCTQAVCESNGNQRCDTSADCSNSFSGFCHHDVGCEARGWCANVQSGCNGATNPIASPNTDKPVFCGCDGVTYEGSVCFARPWRHLGPCEP